jgi:hypothetical protein
MTRLCQTTRRHIPDDYILHELRLSEYFFQAVTNNVFTMVST